MRRALAAALLVLLPGCITDRQWQTIQAHAWEVGIALTAGAGAVLTGGTLGVVVAVAGAGAAVVAGEVTKPEPGTRTIVVQDQPPKPDGTPSPPLVHQYDQDGKRTSTRPAKQNAAGGLDLPGHLDDAKEEVERGWLERAWLTIRVPVLAAGALLVAAYVARTPKLAGPAVATLRALWGSIVWLVGFTLRTLRKGAELLRERLTKPKP